MNTPPPRPVSVLIVEDDPDAADTLAELIRLYGHRAAVARTAAEALAVADQEPPDVALLDIGLPDLDGWQVARWLKEQAAVSGRGRRPLLVAVTARGAEEDRRRTAEVGLDLHRLKAVEPTALAARLARFGGVITPPADGPPDGCL